MKILLLLPILLTLSCTPESSVSNVSSSSGGSTNSTAGLPARWSDASLSSPLNVKLSLDFNSDYSASDYDSNNHDPAEQMMELWNDASTLWTFFQVSASKISNIEFNNLEDYYYNDPNFGIHKSYSWFNDVSSNALAVTQYYGTKSYNNGEAYVEINHADIVLNYSQYTFTMDENDNNAYDLPTVILHELGHFLGLPHTSKSYAVMAPTLSTSQSKRTTYFDRSNIISLYHSNNLSPKSALKNKAISVTENRPGEGDIIRGVIELFPSGKCVHYQNNKIIKSHKVSLQYNNENNSYPSFFTTNQ